MKMISLFQVLSKVVNSCVIDSLCCIVHFRISLLLFFSPCSSFSPLLLCHMLSLFSNFLLPTYHMLTLKNTPFLCLCLPPSLEKKTPICEKVSIDLPKVIILCLLCSISLFLFQSNSNVKKRRKILSFSPLIKPALSFSLSESKILLQCFLQPSFLSKFLM